MSKQLLVSSDSIGQSGELGQLLMRNFLYSLARSSLEPIAVLLMNSGVRLACEGSASLDDLRLLAEKGVAIKACGTCLDYLGLMDSLAVGEVGTMPDSVEAIMGGDQIVVLA